MHPIQHPSNNDVLLPPPGVSNAECRPLPITRVLYKHQWDNHKPSPGLVSYWKPSPTELALLNTGKPLYLSFMGLTHAPVAVGVDGDGLLV